MLLIKRKTKHRLVKQQVLQGGRLREPNRARLTRDSSDVSPGQLSNMKVLITGGAGFIGSHLADALLKKGHQVISYDNYSTGSQLNLATASPGLVSLNGDILDRDRLRAALQEVQSCFHFAAAVGVEKILEDPINSIKTNIHGSENVLELCAELKIPLILASTSEIYGKNSSEILTEDSDRIVGSPHLIRWSYSDAKAIDEAFAIALSRHRGLKVKIIRFFNTVGPRQSPSYGMVIPRFFEAALSNNPLVVHGDGQQRRIFCHVSDAVRGVIALWECEDGFGQAFNLGGHEETSILDLAKKIITITNSGSEILFLPYSELRKRGFEDMARRLPSSAKLTHLTGWSPEKSLHEILVDYWKSVVKSD